MEQMKSTPEQEAVCCCHKKKERDEKEYKDLMNRLSRIEGQVRGVKGMLERGCILCGHSDAGCSY